MNSIVSKNKANCISHDTQTIPTNTQQPQRGIAIIGGGTFNHIRNHLSLAAPAFGTAAKYLCNNFPDSYLYLTRMAGGSPKLNTNADIEELIDLLVKDDQIGTIIMSTAICDFNVECIDNIKNGPHAERLKTEDGALSLNLYPSEKIIKRIRLERPDIFLVGFKTTTNRTELEQYYTALKFMKSTKCNLVLANDVITRRNMVIVPEEAKYFVTTNRNATLDGLHSLIKARQNLTYNRTELHVNSNIQMDKTPITFQKVIQFLVDNGGFIEDNGNGFTPGHFCYAPNSNTFVSSQRKMNHNNVFKNGLTFILDMNDKSDNIVHATGSHKPSVGATSQRLLFKAFPEYNCIVHTHNPLKSSSQINAIPQFNYQCGSIECGKNTLSGMQFHNGIGAVYLEKHGANIMFKSTDDPNRIIKFITDNLKLGLKVQ